MRKLLWSFLVAAVLLVAGSGTAFHFATGYFPHDPEEIEWRLTPDAQRLVEEAYADIAPGDLRDLHTHVVTLGTVATGGYINPRLLSWRHPVERLRTAAYMRASGVESLEAADTAFIARLVRLVRAMPDPGRHYLLALDEFHRQDGRADRFQTEVYVPNNYVFALHEKYPALFDAAVSVHPYRANAVQELEDWARQGVRLVKWLPNVQGMDPADPAMDAYYDVMARYGMVLLTHAGEEQAVPTDSGFQHLGNPLRLRRALDRGVKVIVAHCASLGTDEDLDDPGRKRVASFSLFLRLMSESRYDGLLFGEISAMSFTNRRPEPLRTLLQRPDLHHRLVYGSDYPLPAVNVLVDLGKLEKRGFIDARDVEPLRELYGFNPLLFDFVMARRLHDPETGRRLPASVFMVNPALGL